MLNMKKTLVAAAVTATMAPLAAQAAGELSANIGVTSDYVWRGVSQTTNDPAVSGGIDYADESGFYLGTWVSNVDFGTTDYEWDLYGGFGGGSGDFSWDFNTIYYLYDEDCDCNFWEVGGSVGWKWFTAGLQYTIDGDADDDLPFSEGDVYFYGNASFELQPTWTLGLTLGRYEFDTSDPNFDDDDYDYTHYQIDVGKSAGDFGDFTFSVGGVTDDNDGTYDDDVQVWVSWGKTF